VNVVAHLMAQQIRKHWQKGAFLFRGRTWRTKDLGIDLNLLYNLTCNIRKSLSVAGPVGCTYVRYANGQCAAKMNTDTDT